MLVAAFLVAISLIVRAPAVRAWSRDFLVTHSEKLPGPLRNLVTNFGPQGAHDSSESADAEQQMKIFFSGIPFKPMVIGEDAGGWPVASIGVESQDNDGCVTLQYRRENGTILTLAPFLGAQEENPGAV